MTSALARFFLQEDLNFLVTNRIPRRAATLLVGRLSRIRSRALTRVSLAVFRAFADDLRLDEAETTDFESLHDCFVRRLRPGVRPIDPDPAHLVSPCDAIVGAWGRVRGTEVIQAKGFPYTLPELLGPHHRAERHRDGWFVTLRLKSNMYHRFHAPAAGRLREVTYISGDTWNVNPVALARVERLFCKNERAVLPLELDDPSVAVTLVPVAAILVASIRIHALGEALDLRYRGPNQLPCDARFEKGDELGYFASGSTIIVFASGALAPAPGVTEGAPIRVGEPLFRKLRPAAAQPREDHP